MTTLVEARTAIVDFLRAALPDMKTVASHAGRFDQDELSRLALRAPALLVAALGVSDVAVGGNGERRLNVQWATYVVGVDQSGLRRDLVALDATQRVALLLPHQRWGVDAFIPVRPADVRASNLFDRQGVALWAVSWLQTVRYPREET